MGWVKSLQSLGPRAFWGLLVRDDSSSEIRYCSLVSGGNAGCLEPRRTLIPPEDQRQPSTTSASISHRYAKHCNFPKEAGSLCLHFSSSCPAHQGFASFNYSSFFFFFNLSEIFKKIGQSIFLNYVCICLHSIFNYISARCCIYETWGCCWHFMGVLL